MTQPAVVAERLSKRFEVARREAGVGAALRALFRRDVQVVEAVVELSLTIAAGERVGLLGPNGAGKTTTLKMLAGLLHPSGGALSVVGHVPQRRAPEFLRSIALVMGQKRQLSWDLPAVDTFELHRVVYDIAAADYRRRLDLLTALLGAGEIIRKPVRTLSLGERMKCELIAALLHGPRVLFLDEPTIGLDVAMQLAIRDFIRAYNEEEGATVVLTSHYMEDVAALCPRIIVIDGGRLRFDGSIEALTRRIHPLRRVSLAADRIPDADALGRLGRLVLREEGRLVLDVEPEAVPAVVGELIALPGSRDLVVRDAPSRR
ncbi:MAG: ATP-binding cassette domain-containing protein [Myxococcales bacterium]|nr:ATP-binding cassette domain-containing protein [Myxococcales bacterium]